MNAPLARPAPDTISENWDALRRQPVQAGPWFALACDYAARGLPLQAGYCARQAVQLARGQRMQAGAPKHAQTHAQPDAQPDAQAGAQPDGHLDTQPGAAPDADLAARLDALPIREWRSERRMNEALVRPAPAQAAALAALCEQATAASPGDWLGWLFLARLRELGAAGATPPASADALARAERVEPLAGESLHWLGRWRLAADDAAGAVAAFSRLLDVRPVRCGSMLYLGDALLRIGNGAAAEKAFARASLSNNPDFLLQLAGRVFGHNYWREAIAVLHKALALRPDSVPHLVQLATIQCEVFALGDCRASLARICALDPANPEAARLARAMDGRLGDANAQFAALRRAYALGERSASMASTIAMTSLYNDGLGALEVAALHRDLCAPLEAGPPPMPRAAFANVRDPGRRLRIGYVSGDLHRQHPVNLFMLPVLQRHDHGRFEVCIYHTGAVVDEYTRMARACSDRWLSAQSLDDAALQRAIVDDGIDILVDLAGHSSTHRLGVFARRAAPVQATFLGYPHSTGLAAIDWLIGDAVVSPASHAHLFSEAIAQLPGSVFCWAPVDAYPLPPARAPDAPLVFGSFNNAMKLSPRTIALWAAVLHAVPDAVLLLKSASLADAEVKQRFAGLFGAHGIDPARLRMRGPSALEAMMQEYGEVDVALDPTPYNGGTTTLQALWMGVPVLTLEGANFVSRMGASFLRTMGRSEWVARDDAGYAAAAVALARQRGQLRAGRAALREAMRPLSGIDAYTRHFEAALRGIWASHCADDGRRLLAAGEIAHAARTGAGQALA